MNNIQGTNNKGKSNQKNWVREAMPASGNPMTMSSSIMSSCKTYLGKAYKIQNESVWSDSNESNEPVYDSYDIKAIEDNAANVKTLSDASDDEGDGNLLQTFFEKEVPEGFNSDNFAGAHHEKNISEDYIDNKVSIYSDNMYHKKNTSLIFGGTTNISYDKQATEDNTKIDYNIYSYGKYKSSSYTFGLGVLDTKNSGVDNINISIGTQHNSTCIYAIMQKEISKISGLPTQYKTNINIGIGKSSGLLDPDTYNKKDKSIENINDIDNASQFVQSKESNDFEIDIEGNDNNDDSNSTKNKDNIIVNLIISDTNNNKEYGVKAGKIYKLSNKENNYAFIMPYVHISNLNVDSNEGAKFMTGVNAGQNITFGNGWNIKTKGLVEASRTIITGSEPSDYILANADIQANKNNLNGELSAGCYFDNANAFCKYLEAKVGYAIDKRFSASVKAGLANYKFNEDDNASKICEVSAGVHYTF